jgi:hypothetical protein
VERSVFPVKRTLELRQGEVRRKDSSKKVGPDLLTPLRAAPIGRLPLMTDKGRPTGIRYEDAEKAARRGGSVEFEGRRAKIVRVTVKSSIATTHSARLELVLGDEHLELKGYFRDDEFVETGRKRLN